MHTVRPAGHGSRLTAMATVAVRQGHSVSLLVDFLQVVVEVARGVSLVGRTVARRALETAVAGGEPVERYARNRNVLVGGKGVVDRDPAVRQARQRPTSLGSGRYCRWRYRCGSSGSSAGRTIPRGRPRSRDSCCRGSSGSGSRCHHHQDDRKAAHSTCFSNIFGIFSRLSSICRMRPRLPWLTIATEIQFLTQNKHGGTRWRSPPNTRGSSR